MLKENYENGNIVYQVILKLSSKFQIKHALIFFDKSLSEALLYVYWPVLETLEAIN